MSLDRTVDATDHAGPEKPIPGLRIRRMEGHRDWLARMNPNSRDRDLIAKSGLPTQFHQDNRPIWLHLRKRRKRFAS